jgi:hypothetical protein
LQKTLSHFGRTIRRNTMKTTNKACPCSDEQHEGDLSIMDETVPTGHAEEAAVRVALAVEPNLLAAPTNCVTGDFGWPLATYYRSLPIT